MASGLVRDVVERHPNPSDESSRTSLSNGSRRSSKTGFPVAQHRSKATSAFKRARQDQRMQEDMNLSRRIIGKTETNVGRFGVDKKQTHSLEDTLEDISRSNAEAVERMTEEERQQEREDIINRFGSGVGDLMTKVREARERRAAQEAIVESIDSVSHTVETTSNSIADSRPSSPQIRTTRKIRFVDPTEADVYVYESHPSSPKRTLGLLPPPPENPLERADISHLGTFDALKPKDPRFVPASSPNVGNDENLLEEGTPEDIHRRYFPSEKPPKDNPALAWMISSSTSPSNLSPPDQAHGESPEQSKDILPVEVRYSLSGTRLSSAQISDLPTYLGLHHHASAPDSMNAPAGYTLSDLLLLARSSVPAQRASILGVLTKILYNFRQEIYETHSRPTESNMSETLDVIAMRRDMLDAAIDALGEKGGVGQRAVDLLWEGTVGFTHAEFNIRDLYELPAVDLTPTSFPPPYVHPAYPILLKRTVPRPLPQSLAIIVALPLTKILPALKAQLVTYPSPLLSTHSQILDIIFLLSRFPQHARTIVNQDTGSDVIFAMLKPHIQSPLGSDAGVEKMGVTLTSIHILQMLARNGRDIAISLTGPADVLLRYIMTPLPLSDKIHTHPDEFTLPLQLLEETFVFYSLLAQYGLYAHSATIAQDHFAQIRTWLTTTLRVAADKNVISLACTYLELLGVLMVCATDPHKTTPTHDILWSQVLGWGWADWALDIADIVTRLTFSIVPSESDALKKCDFQRFWRTICQVLTIWVEGASVNGIRGGEEETRLVFSRLRPLFQNGGVAERALRTAITELHLWRFPSSLNNLVLYSLRIMADAAGLVAAMVQLALTCIVSEPGGSLDLPEKDIHEVCMRFLDERVVGNLFAIVTGFSDPVEVPENAHVFIRPLSRLLTLELQLWRRSAVMTNRMAEVSAAISKQDWISQALRVLNVLLPGDEQYAKSIFEILCSDVDSAFVQNVLGMDLPNELWDKTGIKIILPFLIYSLWPTIFAERNDEGGRQIAYVAPILPTSESIQLCTTLSLPSLSHIRSAWNSYDQHLVLPIKNDWVIWPLNHLLRSGSSPVFCNLPSSWDATEIDVVRTSLLLARIVQQLKYGRVSDVVALNSMSRAETIFTCMKVFMLEHGQQQLDSGEEVFRDTLVTRLMNSLLAPFSYANSGGKDALRQVVDQRSSLELVSKAFLGAETPFYQFYTDFLSLYDAISFSHSVFGRLLLPPVSMTYAIDYRRLLFGDFGHAIRTIKINVRDVLCEDIREYLWPMEKDTHMVAWYLKVLLASSAPEGFMRWLAVHHVASNIWPDLRDMDAGNLEQGRNLLSAVVKQGSLNLVRDIALYRQVKEDVWAPPKCYAPDELNRVSRLGFVEKVGDQRVKEQLQNLFMLIT